MIAYESYLVLPVYMLPNVCLLRDLEIHDDYNFIPQVLLQHTGNLFAANGAGVVLAEKGQFDIAKELFTQVRPAYSTLLPF